MGSRSCGMAANILPNQIYGFGTDKIFNLVSHHPYASSRGEEFGAGPREEAGERRCFIPP